MKLSNDIYIHFALEKEKAKIAILKKHTETLRSMPKRLKPEIKIICLIDFK